MYFSSKFVYFCLIPATLALSPRDNTCSTDVTITVTVAQSTVSTATVTTGIASTSFVFLPGNPSPTQPQPRKKRSPCRPSSASSVSTASTSSAATSITSSSFTVAATSSSGTVETESTSVTTPTCPPTSIITVTATTLSASTTTTIVPAPATTTTVYPCATPIVNYQGPAYGDASGTSGLGLSNQIYYLTTPQGASAQACCNTCFFDSPNCVQAYFYFYQGCVVSTATTLTSGSGQHVSNSCPVGTFNGLSYGPDTSPAFRSTGNIAGPCGQAYSNF